MVHEAPRCYPVEPPRVDAKPWSVVAEQHCRVSEAREDRGSRHRENQPYERRLELDGEQHEEEPEDVAGRVEHARSVSLLIALANARHDAERQVCQDTPDERCRRGARFRDGLGRLHVVYPGPGYVRVREQECDANRGRYAEQQNERGGHLTRPCLVVVSPMRARECVEQTVAQSKIREACQRDDRAESRPHSVSLGAEIVQRERNGDERCGEADPARGDRRRSRETDAAESLTGTSCRRRCVGRKCSHEKSVPPQSLHSDPSLSVVMIVVPVPSGRARTS